MPDEVVGRILETARFAPSGGNRQGWRVIVLKDAASRRRLRDIYLDGWYEYLAQASEGLTPWAPITDRAAEQAAVTHAGDFRAAAESGPGGMAEHFDEVPVLLVVLADLRNLAAVDRDLGRYSLAGGASIYPFVWSILLAAHEEGLGGVDHDDGDSRRACGEEAVAGPGRTGCRRGRCVGPSRHACDAAAPRGGARLHVRRLVRGRTFRPNRTDSRSGSGAAPAARPRR